MPESGNQLIGINDRLLALERENREIKGEQRNTEKRVNKLETRADVADTRMKNIEKSLGKIEENTTHTRRQITGIVVGTLSTGIIGGAIAIVWSVVGG